MQYNCHCKYNATHLFYASIIIAIMLWLYNDYVFLDFVFFNYCSSAETNFAGWLCINLWQSILNYLVNEYIFCENNLRILINIYFVLSVILSLWVELSYQIFIWYISVLEKQLLFSYLISLLNTMNYKMIMCFQFYLLQV